MSYCKNYSPYPIHPIPYQSYPTTIRYPPPSQEQKKVELIPQAPQGISQTG